MSSFINISRSSDRLTAVLSMNRAPVNALSREFCDDMRLAIQRLEADESCQSLVLTSALPNVFCAGMDLKQMIQPRLAEFIPFWSSFLRLFVTLFNTRLSTVAAINGHAIAGGTVLALACDFRVVLKSPHPGKPFRLGLSETAIGLPVPDWMCQALERVVGTQVAERMCTSGRLLDEPAALKIGLVDQVVEDPAELLSKSTDLLLELLKLPSQLSRALVKSHFRKSLSNSLLGNLDEISTSMFDTLTLHPIQRALQANAKSKTPRSRL